LEDRRRYPERRRRQFCDSFRKMIHHASAATPQPKEKNQDSPQRHRVRRDFISNSLPRRPPRLRGEVSRSPRQKICAKHEAFMHGSTKGGQIICG
jgi:hypothetical protein